MNLSEREQAEVKPSHKGTFPVSSGVLNRESGYRQPEQLRRPCIRFNADGLAGLSFDCGLPPLPQFNSAALIPTPLPHVRHRGHQT